jgi:alpha-amylase
MIRVLFLLILVSTINWAARGTDRMELFQSFYADEKVSPTEILFQGFTWDASVNGQKYIWYKHLESKIPELKKAGITHVWFPPVSRSVSPQGYMPGDYYDLGEGEELSDNKTLYGNAKELKSAVRAMKKAGIVPIADIVINHRCGSHQEDGQWNVFHHKSGKMLWEKWAIVKGDYNGTGNSDTGGDFGAAPDIDHTNATVRADIIRWMNWLKSEVGFEGWRYDYTKGYDAYFINLYNKETHPVFSVGEYWTSMGYRQKYLLPDQDAHRQEIVDWLDRAEGNSRSFDFTTKGILQTAVQNGEYWRLKDKDGRAAGVVGWWPEKAVTFIDNHDTGSTQAHWPFPSDKVLEGYAYIMTHPGTPTIFWDHLFTWGDDVRNTIIEMANLRHEFNIHKTSELNIWLAEQNLYVAETDGAVLLKIGPKSWQPEGNDWQVRIQGSGFTIWTRR